MLLLAVGLFAVDSFIRKYSTCITIIFNNKEIYLDIKKIWTKFTNIIIVLSLLLNAFFIEKDFSIIEFAKRKNENTTVYEDYYTEFDGSNVTINSKKRNLILIYMESMETSFMSKEDGGFLDDELIPNLRKLANDNINFSFTDDVGGFNAIYGTTWTTGGLFASQSGLPFMFHVDSNDLSINGEYDSKFLKNIYTLTDFLNEQGYTQEFVCGSDSSFGSKKAFYTSHGDVKIYDVSNALEEDRIDKEVWWGFNDEILYDVCKDELINISDSDNPFCFIMLTEDTHHVGGYKCDLCEDTYETQYANVIKCADNQIYNFVNWIKEQEFYEDTTIVILGDHPTMDSTLISSNLDGSELITDSDEASKMLSENENRYVYNCFINSNCSGEYSKNRQFNTLDMYPTILASVGFETSDRLHLGTNLFSGEKTLQEELGYEYLNKELSKYSQFCIDNFYD